MPRNFALNRGSCGSTLRASHLPRSWKSCDIPQSNHRQPCLQSETHNPTQKRPGSKRAILSRENIFLETIGKCRGHTTYIKRLESHLGWSAPACEHCVHQPMPAYGLAARIQQLLTSDRWAPPRAHLTATYRYYEGGLGVRFAPIALMRAVKRTIALEINATPAAVINRPSRT